MVQGNKVDHWLYRGLPHALGLLSSVDDLTNTTVDHCIHYTSPGLLPTLYKESPLTTTPSTSL